MNQSGACLCGVGDGGQCRGERDQDSGPASGWSSSSIRLLTCPCLLPATRPAATRCTLDALAALATTTTTHAQSGLTADRLPCSHAPKPTQTPPSPLLCTRTSSQAPEAGAKKLANWAFTRRLKFLVCPGRGGVDRVRCMVRSIQTPNCNLDKGNRRRSGQV